MFKNQGDGPGGGGDDHNDDKSKKRVADDASSSGAHKKMAQPEFRCISCNKVFSSYQGLGGHRSKCKLKLEAQKPDEDNSRQFPCDACKRVCKSPQGLANHKSVCKLRRVGRKLDFSKAGASGGGDIVIQDDNAASATGEVDRKGLLLLSDEACRQLDLRKPGPGGNGDDDDAPASDANPSLPVS